MSRIEDVQEVPSSASEAAGSGLRTRGHPVESRERGELGTDEVLHPDGLAVDDHGKVQPPPTPVHVRAPCPDTS
jgi:hypothetical protein